MGVVVKQSFWGTAIAYLGVAVGYLNALYFRAAYLTLEQIGLFTLVTAHAMMISPLSLLGTSSSYVKFFPSFSTGDKHRFFSFLFLIIIIGNAIVLSVGYFLKDAIALRYSEQAENYTDYILITGVVILSNSLFELFFSYSRSIMEVIFPSFIRDIYLRLGSLMLVMGFAFSWWSFDAAMYGLGGVYFGAFVLLLLQLIIVHKFRFDFRVGVINSEWRAKLLRFGSYSMLLALSFALYNNVSYDQITSHLGAEANGIFQTCFFIALIVEMPRRNMLKIIGPIISSEIQKNDWKEVTSVYRRSSITMSVIGMLLFIGIISNLQDLFDFIPKGDEFRAGFWVVIFICLSKVSTMLSSFPGEIINFSQYYRYNLLFQLFTVLILISLNYFFIPAFGINGAALAFFIATITQNVINLFYVYYQYRILPFTKSHFYLFGICLVVSLLAFLFNPGWHPALSISVRSILTSALFIFLIFYFNISEDINRLIRSTFDRFLKIRIFK